MNEQRFNAIFSSAMALSWLITLCYAACYGGVMIVEHNGWILGIEIAGAALATAYCLRIVIKHVRSAW